MVLAAGDLVQLLWPLIPAQRKRLTFARPRHCDFRTPEYEMVHTRSEQKWELARGVGHSFGANRYERPEDIVSATELIQLFCDVVAKNGNLLIGVGPRPDGTIPESQQAPLLGLGAWLGTNGEAVYGSRPWAIAESEAVDGDAVALHLVGQWRVLPRDGGAVRHAGWCCGPSTARGCRGCAWSGPTTSSSGPTRTVRWPSPCPSAWRSVTADGHRARPGAGRAGASGSLGPGVGGDGADPMMEGIVLGRRPV